MPNIVASQTICFQYCTMNEICTLIYYSSMWHLLTAIYKQSIGFVFTLYASSRNTSRRLQLRRVIPYAPLTFVRRGGLDTSIEIITWEATFWVTLMNNLIPQLSSNRGWNITNTPYVYHMLVCGGDASSVFEFIMISPWMRCEFIYEFQ